jgi:hypothetical protein
MTCRTSRLSALSPTLHAREHTSLRQDVYRGHARRRSSPATTRAPPVCSRPSSVCLCWPPSALPACLRAPSFRPRYLY